MINPSDFVNDFGNQPKEQLIKFAKVSPNYSTGRPTLVFDGETTESNKAYPYLSSYNPSPGDRVMLVKGVVVGNIV